MRSGGKLRKLYAFAFMHNEPSIAPRRHRYTHRAVPLKAVRGEFNGAANRMSRQFKMLEIRKLRPDLAARKSRRERLDAGNTHEEHAERHDAAMTPLILGIRPGGPPFADRIVHDHGGHGSPPLSPIVKHSLRIAAFCQRSINPVSIRWV